MSASNNKSRTKAKHTEQEKRQYVQAPVAIDVGIPCSHCGHRYGHRKAHKYPNGNQRYVCSNTGCGLPFVVMRTHIHGEQATKM